MTQDKIQSRVELTLYRMGFLDSSTDDKDIPPGSKLELPFWLAYALCSQKRRIVSVELPKAYRESYREVMKADANVVNLYKLGPYYYNFGMKLQCFSFPEIDDVSKCLLSTFQTRFRKIMDASQNIMNEDTSKLTSNLDEMEKALFKVGQKSLTDFQLWETRQVEKLKTSDMVRAHRKRKREDE
ncbi:GINS3 [Acanthosepion pharaonis]|uniref:DNA replication complex GINS protein PSF3 n=1 Tax=Acanthosepion pharaonis TaxID=158019 RepID=A0A812DPL6_ACAPH|nr:GINS3 [Sepia pharaonis]